MLSPQFEASKHIFLRVNGEIGKKEDEEEEEEQVEEEEEEEEKEGLARFTV